jgi:dTDP-4-amino-4,6-dideoxygalactose transaminase
MFKQLLRLGYHQVRNLIRFVRGRSLTYPPLGSVTLDEDDVSLAKAWLKSREQWYDCQIVQQYEQAFSQWNGSEYAYAFMGGRVALSACIHALGLQPGDEVIIPGYTCVVVPNAFHFAGVETIYSDIELDTYGLDVALIEEKITPYTKAILLHHLYGLVCRDYEKIIAIAREHNLYIIEDCAQSTGAEYKGKKVGTHGDVGFYSSEQSKVFTTIQGGLAVTDDPTIAEGLQGYLRSVSYPDEAWIERQLYNVILNYYRFKHPQRWWRGDWISLRLGNKRLISTTTEEEQGRRPDNYGRKMPASIAALGINQLEKIDHYNELRRQTAKRWDAWCDANGYEKPVIVSDSLPVYLRYPVLVEPEKKRNLKWGAELGVELGRWFVSNLHPAKFSVDGCPNANAAVERCVNFPGVVI